MTTRRLSHLDTKGRARMMERDVPVECAGVAVRSGDIVFGDADGVVVVPREQLRSEVWVMEKNSNYWNKGLPYLEGVEFYHVLPFSPEMASAILAGRVDYIRATDPVTTRKAKATQGMSSDNRRNRWASDDTFLSRSATTRL